MADIRTETGTATTRDGVALAYGITGPAGGRRIVLIHSLALDASVWDEVVPLLARDNEVLRYDCRGHGGSARPAGPYTVEQFGDDLADLLDRIGWSDALVAGCSMGGCVAQAFAAAYPERVTGLVLIDTTDWYGPEAPKTWRERAAVAQRDGLAGMAGFQTTRWFGDAYLAQHPERVTELMSVFTANDLSAYAASCVMMGDADLRGRLAGAPYPVAVIVGSEDYATPVTTAERLRDAIPGASLTVIAKARHLTPVECPDVIVEVIGDVASREGAETTMLT